MAKQQQQSSNRDLILCENKFFVDKSKPENLFNFKSAEKRGDDKQSTGNDSSFKTEKLTSNVLPRIKDFMDALKSNKSFG
ncbi:hypothetical protein DERF_001076 [Dermatophagoides farinae]|uniref:Uncharacterized protein n=1 Tax=Dermatophagoides farinae TaxID=6954 RepID=A0A922IA44_DERFA|nr:hypothetical protein DERF_001076 [Dermatophagoides farinae]